MDVMPKRNHDFEYWFRDCGIDTADSPIETLGDGFINSLKQ